MIGESQMSISGGYLHIPVRVHEQFLDDARAQAQCFPTGDVLRICIENTPYDLVLDVPLSEWHIDEPKDRSMYDYSIHINRWHEKLDTYEEDGREFVDVEMGIASVENVDVAQMLKDTDKGITFQEASRIVDDYLQERGHMSSRIKTSHVVDAMGIEHTNHNLKRIHDALAERCEVEEKGQYGTKVFKSPMAEEAEAQ